MAKCKHCGKIFEAKQGQRYCSDRCRSDAKEAREHIGPAKVTKVCKTCGEEFETASHRVTNCETCRRAICGTGDKVQVEKYDPSKAAEKSERMTTEYGFDYGAEQKRRILEEVANKAINKKTVPEEVPEEVQTPAAAPEPVLDNLDKVDTMAEPVQAPAEVQAVNVVDRADTSRDPLADMVHVLGAETARTYFVGSAFMSLIAGDIGETMRTLSLAMELAPNA